MPANFFASLIERKVHHWNEKLFCFESKVWRIMFCWSAAALLQYYLLIKALSSMREAAMASLTWPMLIGVNVTSFSICCRLKWKEKYPWSTIIGMAGCVIGIIMMIIGRK